MLKKVGLAVAALVAAWMAVVALQPSSFHIERSTTISAPAEVVFAQINDFHAWGAWSPWDHLDPNQQRTFTGSPSGQGAVYDWNGNDKVGQGRMTITRSKPSEAIEIKLEFIKPWAAVNQTKFVLKADKGTTVTWSLDGNFDFMGKAMSLFMSMDKQVGGDFERGLAQLKQVVEKRAAEAPVAPPVAPPPPPPT